MNNNLYKKILFSTVFVFSGILGACSSSTSPSSTNSSSVVASSSSVEESLPDSIEQLVYRQGSLSSEVVVVNTQGGPIPELAKSEFLEIMGQAKVDLSKMLIVNVHQVQTKNPEWFTSKEISFDKAKEYDQESVKNLAKVIRYFKAKSKTVYVLGISFGAFMTQELISNYGVDIADKYLIMVGRLNIPDPFWTAFSEGKGGGFTNGVTPYYNEASDVGEGNMYRLAAGLGHKRYMALWEKYTDMSNVIYAYGEVDEQVGKLTDEEVSFLKEKKVTILKSEKGHSGAIDDKIEEGFKIMMAK